MMAEELENFGDEMILENNEFIRIQLLRRKEAYCNGIRSGSESTVLQGHEYARTIITPLACRISKVYGYFSCMYDLTGEPASKAPLDLVVELQREHNDHIQQVVGSSYALPLTAEDAGELLEEQLQFEREFSKITTNDNDVKMKLETGCKSLVIHDYTIEHMMKQIKELCANESLELRVKELEDLMYSMYGEIL